jgi:hypothetical protein
MEEKEEEEMITKKEFQELKQKERLLREASEVVSTREEDLLKTIERFQKDLKD